MRLIKILYGLIELLIAIIVVSSFVISPVKARSATFRNPLNADPNLDGQIDQFRIYNRALSAAEIPALFQTS